MDIRSYIKIEIHQNLHVQKNHDAKVRSNTDVHTLISQQSLHSYAKQMYGAINDMKGTKYVEFRVNSTMQSSCRDKTHLRAI